MFFVFLGSQERFVLNPRPFDTFQPTTYTTLFFRQNLVSEVRNSKCKSFLLRISVSFQSVLTLLISVRPSHRPGSYSYGVNRRRNIVGRNVVRVPFVGYKPASLFKDLLADTREARSRVCVDPSASISRLFVDYSVFLTCFVNCPRRDS